MTNTLSLCECGCGTEVAGRFSKGHNWRGKKRGPNGAFAGRTHSAETKARISAANAGKRRSDETKRRLSESKLGECNPLWKGEDVSYSGLHAWVLRNKLKTGICTECGAEVGTSKRTGTEWHNVSGEYKRDLNDFVELCKSCHAKKGWERRG